MYSGIIPIVKQAALDAVDATQPVNLLFGTVTSVSPLKVQITPKLTLGAGNLVVAGRLSKQTFTVSGNTGGVVNQSSVTVEDHKHSVGIRVTIDNSLKKGDSVILARIQGGTQYLILDKAVK